MSSHSLGCFIHEVFAENEQVIVDVYYWIDRSHQSLEEIQMWQDRWACGSPSDNAHQGLVLAPCCRATGIFSQNLAPQVQ